MSELAKNTLESLAKYCGNEYSFCVIQVWVAGKATADSVYIYICICIHICIYIHLDLTK